MCAQVSSPNLKQLVLDLPHREALGLEDFLVSSSNEAAVNLIDCWPNWTAMGAVVIGPSGSGKSHLSHVWRLRSGAETRTGATINEEVLISLQKHGAIAIEDIDQGISDERVFFHILNLLKEKGYALLVTSRLPPGELKINLPDLRSRLTALPVAHIKPPDNELLKAVMIKLFADRQLVVEPHVVNYLALHMERSFEALQRIVEECDRFALSRQRNITRVVAAEVLTAQANVITQDKDFD
ncbi:MAG: DnaA ATPase domain-containing protein [Hyphomicrobium sp.]